MNSLARLQGDYFKILYFVKSKYSPTSDLIMGCRRTIRIYSENMKDISLNILKIRLIGWSVR